MSIHRHQQFLPKTHSASRARTTIGTRHCFQSFGHTHALFWARGFDLCGESRIQSVHLPHLRHCTYTWQFHLCIATFWYRSSFLHVLIGQSATRCFDTRRHSCSSSPLNLDMSKPLTLSPYWISCCTRDDDDRLNVAPSLLEFAVLFLCQGI
jgi:hypothetical protein